jgi:chromosome segregation ATPase
MLDSRKAELEARIRSLRQELFDAEHELRMLKMQDYEARIARLEQRLSESESAKTALGNGSF